MLALEKQASNSNEALAWRAFRLERLGRDRNITGLKGGLLNVPSGGIFCRGPFVQSGAH